MLKPDKILPIFSLIIFFVLLFSPNLAAAGIEDVKPPDIKIHIGDFEGWAPGQGITQAGKNLEISWLSDYISVIYRYGVGLAAVLAVVMIMVGGFIWLTSAGSPDKVGKAKEFITGALTGLFLALFSFIILYTVNPQLVALKPLVVPVPEEVEVKSNIISGPGCCVTVAGGPAGATKSCSQESDLIDCQPSTERSQTSFRSVTPYQGTQCDTIDDCQNAEVVDHSGEAEGCCKTTTIGMGGTGITCERSYDLSTCVSPGAVPGGRGAIQKEPFPNMSCDQVAGCP